MKEEILEGNKLIAEFMGCEFGHGFWAGAGDYFFPGNTATASELKYHSSWDWLMPVVEKIEKVGCVVQIWKSNAAGCKITKIGSRHEKPKSFTIEGNSLIEAVYETVVDFIKWHNTNQK